LQNPKKHKPDNATQGKSAESSQEGCGYKRAVLQMMMIMITNQRMQDSQTQLWHGMNSFLSICRIFFVSAVSWEGNA
jgi:hypothetical protein